MKTFNKTYLPDIIKYNGESYKLDAKKSANMTLNNVRPERVIRSLKTLQIKAVLVKVLSKSLGAQTDLHGKPYKQRNYIYTNQKK